MKTRYKISEVAKIFNISRQTLIFYHKKNILVPFEIDEENGYRYYSKNQIWELMFILTLKRAGLSLEEIKSFSELRTPQENIDFLGKKVEELEKRIKELEKVKEKISRRVKNLKEYLVENEEKIMLKKYDEIMWYYLEMKNPRDEKEMVENYEKLDEIARENGIEDVSYINIIDLRNLESIGEDEIIPVLKLGIAIPSESYFIGCEKLKVGECFAINHKDSYLSINDTYKKIDRYIKERGYKNSGYSIEFMKELAISTEDGIGGIIEILIPVSKIDK